MTTRPELRQFDVVRHPVARLRAVFPFLVVLQSDFAESPERLVAPLVPWPSSELPKGNRALPQVEIEGQPFGVALLLMGPLPPRMLRNPVGSVTAYRDAIGNALDWIFWGL